MSIKAFKKVTKSFDMFSLSIDNTRISSMWIKIDEASLKTEFGAFFKAKGMQILHYLRVNSSVVSYQSETFFYIFYDEWRCPT